MISEGLGGSLLTSGMDSAEVQDVLEAQKAFAMVVRLVATQPEASFVLLSTSICSNMKTGGCNGSCRPSPGGDLLDAPASRLLVGRLLAWLWHSVCFFCFF